MKYFQFVLIPNKVNLVSVRGRRRGPSWKVHDGKYLSKPGTKYLSERRRNICPMQKGSHSMGQIKAERKSAKKSKIIRILNIAFLCVLFLL